MHKKTFAAAVFFVGLVFVLCCATAQGDELVTAREFLEQYGWETARELCEKEEVKIPQEFDEVYKRYNELQIKSGYDLTEYAGKTVTRYTFLIKNYPLDVGERVYGNVLCVDGYAIGGDIMTRSMTGFMHSVTENAPYF